MRMVPSTPLLTDSKAELKVFDQLRTAFSSGKDTGWFAMHSLNLPRHEYKRWGEIDFIVCGPGGVFAFEVKGGGVSCRDGVWETTNRYGTNRLSESPFRQAEGGMQGLRDKKLPDWLSRSFVWGYGVIMPDVGSLPDSAEWDRPVLACSKEFKEFERWLIRLVQHWRAKDSRKLEATPEQLKQLQQYLRPNFEAVVPLHVTSDVVSSQLAKLEDEQLELIDAVEENERVLCSGGAGTGKTLVGLELARRWASTGINVVMTCHSPWLKSFLEKNPIPGLTVCLSDAIHVAARRNGIERFDALIVDEGQDVLNMEILARLDEYVVGGLEQGRWCFFHDINNQSGLCGDYVPDAYEYLHMFRPMKVPLRKNRRNAMPILNCIQSTLEADMGAAGVGQGPAVRQFSSGETDELVEAIENELEALIEKEGFSNGELVVLSHLPFSQSLVSKLSPRWQQSMSVLDASSPLNATRKTIGFAQIPDFKGLESQVVILVDLPPPGSNKDLRNLHYVGMSRARALLSIISVEA